MATVTYSVGRAQLVAETTASGQIIIKLILPSGRVIANIDGWTREMFNQLITSPTTADDDASALQSVSSSYAEVVPYLKAELAKLQTQTDNNAAGNPIDPNAADGDNEDPFGGQSTPATVTDDEGNPLAEFADDDAIENEDPEPIDADEDPGVNTADDDNEESVENRDPSSVGEEEASPYGTDYQAKGEPVLSEDGTPSGFLRNPETGDLYTDDGTQVGGTEEPVSSSDPSSRGLFGAQTDARTEASVQDQSNFAMKEDWRVRLSLAPGANYLYKAPNVQGILAPLAATDGVIFPYTPNIQVGYSAAYDATSPTHSNYKIYQYTNSSVDNVSITCDFTAQDTFEANYLLAVIHFFRTLTKMFYGQDQNPKPGTPPPLVFLYGLGAFQFNAHPLVVTNFNYNLPNDVDYIRAAVTTTYAGVNKAVENPSGTNTNTSGNRLGSGILPGGIVPKTTFDSVPGGTVEPTYVPTRMQIQISALPIITRNQISNAFSLKDYATGKLLQGTKRAGGGIW
jgi:hypothetical protein